jgi:regulator of protease activity HflC (stomatin/prohibitin superfamily)
VRDPRNWSGTVIQRILIGIAAILVLAWLWPFASVPTGSRGVVTQFGRIVRIQPEGLAVLPPWQALTLFSIRAEQADIDRADGSTADTQPVETSLTVRYSIIPDKVSEVFEKYSHNGNLDSYVNTATHEVFKAVTAQYTAPDLIAKRPQVSQDIYNALSAKLDKYGAQVINIDMRNFAFSQQYMAAINDKVTQEQLRLAAENKLKTVEAEQKQKVAIAEAEANAVKATADGQAYATKTRAQAEADAIRVKQAALAQGQQVLELNRIQVLQTQAERWDGKLPENLYGSAPIPIINQSH